MKKLVINTLNFILKKLSKYESGIKLIDKVVYISLNRNKKVIYKNIELIYSIPNYLNHYRAETFSIKEPETLD